MNLSDIQIPVSSIQGVGPAAEAAFARLNIFSVADLLCHYPRDWEDRTHYIPLKDFNQHKKINTIAKVIAHEWFGFGAMKTLKIIITDNTSQAALICFNRPFLEKTYPINSIIHLTGSFYIKYNQLQSANFDGELLCKKGEIQDFLNGTLPSAKVLPIYKTVSGLSQTQLRKAIQKALSEYSKGISTQLPADIIEKYNLFEKKDALQALHNPASLEELKKAQKSIIFEELYFFQKGIVQRFYHHKGKLPQLDDELELQDLLNQKDTTEQNDNISHLFVKSLSPRQKILAQRLPFQLTFDQQRTILQINIDIDNAEDKNHCQKTMSRLIQGDVGSGKTLVAFFAMLRIIDMGGQCAILAPTEILAKQHGENAAELLEPCNVQLAFLTGSVKNQGKNLLQEKLKNGEIDVVIGTHALFSKNVHYNNLQLVIIDEQHRFGVLQRNAIMEKGLSSLKGNQKEPHLLMMSATPIPQTLALTVFGDLDVSTIKTMPAGRIPIRTYLTQIGHEDRVYEAVRQQLQQGFQAYFVYPRIENDETEEETSTKKLKSAEEMFDFLQNSVFPEFRLGLVHSKISQEDQNQILADFKKGKIQAIIATSVVEVGVDVPNATCMIIEQAERFGLAALHQLRGRVGRGKNPSHCFLIYSQKITEIGKERLKAIHQSTDGFAIAEQDMLLRGPGEVLGIQQSGYFTLGLADPIRDRELLLIARKEAILHFTEQE